MENFNIIILLILSIISIYLIFKYINYSGKSINQTKTVDQTYKPKKGTYINFSNEEIKMYGKPIFTKTIFDARNKNIKLQATLFDSGIVIYNNQIIHLNQNELLELIELKKAIVKENPHCCPDFDYSKIDDPYLYFYDENKLYNTNGSCLVSTMASFNILDNKLKNIIKPNTWV